MTWSQHLHNIDVISHGTGRRRTVLWRNRRRRLFGVGSSTTTTSHPLNSSLDRERTKCLWIVGTVSCDWWRQRRLLVAVCAVGVQWELRSTRVGWRSEWRRRKNWKRTRSRKTEEIIFYETQTVTLLWKKTDIWKISSKWWIRSLFRPSWGGGTIYSNAFFCVQTILTDRYIHRTELWKGIIKKPVQCRIWNKEFFNFRFS